MRIHQAHLISTTKGGLDDAAMIESSLEFRKVFSLWSTPVENAA